MVETFVLIVMQKKTMNLMLEAQWVLVDHAKNGNNTKELNDVSEKLKEFVFDK